MTEPYIFCWDIQIPKTVQYPNDFKHDRTLHPIVCGDIQIPTEKCSSELKWFLRSHNFTSFVEAFKSQQKKTVWYWNHFKYDRILHLLLGLSNSNWQNLTSFVGTFKFQLKTTVQHRNDYKTYRTLHSWWGQSNFNWKRQFSIEIIWEMTEPYFLCWDIQIPNANNSSVSKWFQRWHVKDYRALLPLWGHSNPNWTRQISIEMIAKMTEPYILPGDIQLKTEKDCSVLKWFQRWQAPTSFVRTFKIQLKKTVQYWKDLKDHKTLHASWGHPNPDRKRQFSIEMIIRTTKPYLLGHSNSNWQNLTLHLMLGHSKSNWKRQFSIEMISKMTESYIICRNIQFPT